MWDVHNVSSPPAIGYEGTIYIGTDDGLQALENDGTVKWEYLIDAKIHKAPSVGLDQTIYFGSKNKNLYAINPDGTEKWVFAAAGSVLTSPSIGWDGTLYIHVDDFSSTGCMP